VRRREFLAVALAVWFAQMARESVWAAPAQRQVPYMVDVGLLYNALGLRLSGSATETIDPDAGRYSVAMSGEGAGLASRLESRGVLRAGRWAPSETTSWFDVRGREARSTVRYDYDRRTVEIHARSETFFLRRQRVLDDLVALPDGSTVDDVVSALLNYAEGRWSPGVDGTLRTLVVRRRRSEHEGPDDVQRSYRAELTPLVLSMGSDPGTGQTMATFDLAPFSSWARQGSPAVVAFRGDRRPERITCSMILGTSLAIRFDTT
jgi:hypothetical protein